jgi:hypothetical protein
MAIGHSNSISSNYIYNNNSYRKSTYGYGNSSYILQQQSMTTEQEDKLYDKPGTRFRGIWGEAIVGPHIDMGTDQWTDGPTE